MKTGMLIVCSLLLNAVVAHGEASAPHKNDAGDIGRFQLFQGTFTAVDLKRQEARTQQAVFVIDTKTGRVRRYVSKIDTDGNYVEEWLPTELSTAKK